MELSTRSLTPWSAALVATYFFFGTLSYAETLVPCRFSFNCLRRIFELLIFHVSSRTCSIPALLYCDFRTLTSITTDPNLDQNLQRKTYPFPLILEPLLVTSRFTVLVRGMVHVVSKTRPQTPYVQYLISYSMQKWSMEIPIITRSVGRRSGLRGLMGVKVIV